MQTSLKHATDMICAADAMPSPSNVGYRAGDMALLGLVMAALLVLCLIVIGFLISRLRKGNSSLDKLCEVSVSSCKIASSIMAELTCSLMTMQSYLGFRP